MRGQGQKPYAGYEAEEVGTSQADAVKICIVICHSESCDGSSQELMWKVAAETEEKLKGKTVLK
jgi:hypothetical protein